MEFAELVDWLVQEIRNPEARPWGPLCLPLEPFSPALGSTYARSWSHFHPLLEPFTPELGATGAGAGACVGA